MNRLSKFPVKEVTNAPRLFQKKSLLFSSECSDDLNRMAEESSRARLIRHLVQPDEYNIDYEECLKPQKSPNPLASKSYQVPERKQFVAAYPGSVGLRWNPCVEVSSQEDIPIKWTHEKPRLCKCTSCTSKHCPSKKSSHCIHKRVFKDNIMTFSDKCTMTPKVNHACCSARSPLASPNPSNLSMSGSNSRTRIHTSANCPRRSHKKPCLQSDEYKPKPLSYDEAVRDTDLNEQCSLRKTYFRQCCSHSSGTQYGLASGRVNLYNEGISDSVASKYPLSTHCSHDVRFGGPVFCMNKCPDCHCRRPSAGKESKYHQQCKVVKYNRPVYYDTSSENCRIKATPNYITHRYVAPVRQPSKTLYDRGIKLPKKVLTSERDIDAYISDDPCNVRRSRRKKSKHRS